jgi:ABC-2 type transport system permease protein
MYGLLIKQFTRSRMSLIALFLLLAMGIVSILIGRQFLLKQEETISIVTEHQRKHIERNVAANDEMGLLLYYLKFSLISQPEKLAALSIGQRDVNPGIQSVTIRTLEGQKYDTDLTNPMHLQLGNLDLGFVIIYLFPLVIIAFTFNLFSEDNETGTWKLVVSQSRSPFRFLLAKFSVRVFFIYSVLFTLILIAALVLSLPIDECFAAFVVLSLLYLAFWFVLCFWLSMFKRSSGFNVLTLLTIWVVLTILAPASINNFVSVLYAVPESLATMVKQRDGYHEKWDMDKKITMDKFYAHYPQFEKYGVPTEAFSWLWYYAMQQMGDDESLAESQAMRNKILQREKTSSWIASAIPTLHTQMQFNALAHTSLTDYITLLDSAGTFHEEKRLYFYPKIFENADVKNEDWTKFKPTYLASKKDVHWSSITIPLVLLTSLLFIWGSMKSRSISSRVA